LLIAAFKKRGNILPKRMFVAVVMILLAVCGVSLAQTLQNLVNQPPDGAIVGFLLTDGTVMYQGNAQSDWWRLTPDKSGSYINGTWKQLASLPAGYVPLYFAAAVLADGRLIIEGGEYNSLNFAFTNQGAVYDPAKEGWTLMPDGSVLTFDVTKAPHSERYDASQQKWISAGSTIVDLHSPTTIQGCIPYGKNGCYYPPGEVGPGMLQPDGTMFATGSGSNGGGGPGHTSVYHPSTGKWIVGPDFPNGDNAGDSYAVLLPNGHPLVVGVSGSSYEFDGKNLKSGPFLGYFSHLMVLPTGEVIVGGSEVYTATGKPNPTWAPSVTQYPHTVARGSTYKVSGKQFNGLSQAQAFGDELTSVTNYPLVRITNTASGHVFYAKTHDHSSMGVATGSAIVSTKFDVPSGMETGASTLEVVANGIPSKGVSVTVK
jgi:hypothetical protein